MSIEIEFLPVGDGSRAGDCIVVRYGEPNEYQLMVIDGGTTASGEALVAHIRNHFPDAYGISHVVLTHADGDHASGLRELLCEFPIGTLWMHLPWEHAEDAVQYFDGMPDPARLAQKIRKAHNILGELVDEAEKRKIPIRQPFAGDTIGPFTVLSPTLDLYAKLLPQFERTPAPDRAALDRVDAWIGKGKTFDTVALESASVDVPEDHDTETLGDAIKTSASNESSVVLYAEEGQRRYLTTGDAGLVALDTACKVAEKLSKRLQQFTFVQVPHHGSRHNVGPAILDQLIGEPRPKGSKPRGTAFVSVPKDDAKHPRKVVMNAFIRRGYRVYMTQGRCKVYRGGFPQRESYVTAVPVEFSTYVESDD